MTADGQQRAHVAERADVDLKGDLVPCLAESWVLTMPLTII
jgi:hypothetical protein